MYVPNWSGRNPTPQEWGTLENSEKQALPKSMQKIYGRTLKVANTKGGEFSEISLRLEFNQASEDGPAYTKLYSELELMSTAMVNGVKQRQCYTLFIGNGLYVQFNKYDTTKKNEGLLSTLLDKGEMTKFFNTMVVSLESAKIEGDSITLSGIDAYRIKNN